MDTGLGGMLEALDTREMSPHSLSMRSENNMKQHQALAEAYRILDEKGEKGQHCPRTALKKQVHAGAFATVQQWQVWDWWMASSNRILAKLVELVWMDMDRIDILGNHVTVSNMVNHVSKPLRCNEIQGFCDTAERRLAETEAVSSGGFLDILFESAIQS